MGQDGIRVPEQRYAVLITLFNCGANRAAEGNLDSCEHFAEAIFEEIESLRRDGGAK